MSSAWAKASRKRPFTLKPRPLCLKVDSKGSTTRLKVDSSVGVEGDYPDQVTVPLSDESPALLPLHDVVDS